MEKSLRFPMLLSGSMILFLLSWMIILKGGTSFIIEMEFFSSSSLSFCFSLVLDKISLSFGVVVTIISSSVFIFASKYMEDDPFKMRFLWILFTFVLSMNFLTLSGSLLFLLVGWDGLGITSFALIVYYQSESSVLAGFQTMMINRLGDVLIVLSTFLFVLSEQFSYYSLTFMFINSGLIMILMLASLTKSAQYPFSSWLPAAMAAPTPVSALVHSSTLVTAGIFLIIRLTYNIPLSDMFQSLLLFFGSVTCLLGGWSALYENDLKKVIALSTLSQLGVMVFSLGLGQSTLSLFHLYTHAMFKALLFLAAGSILMSSFGAQDIRLLGGIGLSMPYTIVMFNVSSLCLIGAPFLSAFYSKHMILEITVNSSLNIFSFVLMLIATFFTSNYVFYTLKSISWSKPVISTLSVNSNFFSVFPVLLLSLGGILSGKIFFYMDMFNLEIPCISFFWALIINLVTVLGILSGVMSKGKKVSWWLSSLFFLSPSLNSNFMSFISPSLKYLDHGWLEIPSSLKLLNIKTDIFSYFVWPQKQATVLAGLILYLILVSQS